MTDQDGLTGRRLGVRDVAERAGVAISSVSRVLSGHPNVSPVMRRRVLDAVAASGYEPNLVAQSMRRGETMTVGFVVGDISNPLLAHIALGAEVGLRNAGYSMVLLNSGNDPGLDAAHIALLRRRQVDGLLLSLADEDSPDTLVEIERSGVPCVMIDRASDRAAGASAVLSDHAAGITAAAEHLLALGHRRITLINGNPKVRPARERAAALRKVCRGHIGVRASVRSGGFSDEHGARATTAALTSADPPTAIIAGGNQILTGVLRVLNDRGLRVPGDVSVVTCDNVPLAEFLRPPLATISRDTAQIGTVAAELMLERLRGERPRTVTLPTEFRASNSCGTPPGATRGRS